MSVTLNTQNAVFDGMRSQPAQNRPSFKANEEVTIQPKAQDEVVTQEPKKKKGIIRKFKDGFSSVKKFFIGVGEYAKSTVKGLLYGGIAAAGVVGVDAIMNVTKIVKGANTGEFVGKTVKVLSTKGKVAAGAVGLAVLGYNLFKASLNVSEKNANVDHRWGSGHNA